jgi:hypothetical protein
MQNVDIRIQTPIGSGSESPGTDFYQILMMALTVCTSRMLRNLFISFSAVTAVWAAVHRLSPIQDSRLNFAGML